MTSTEHQDIFQAMMKLKRACNSYNTCGAAYAAAVKVAAGDPNNVKKTGALAAAADAVDSARKAVFYQGEAVAYLPATRGAQNMELKTLLAMAAAY
jgi:hypothetical protein